MNYNIPTYKPFWRILPQDILVGTSPKCGATTLQKWAKSKAGRSYGHDIDRPKYFFVREPLARFMSLYNDKCRVDLVQGNTDVLRGLSVTELIEFIEGGTHWNQHWGRQLEILGDVDAALIPLESMSDVLGAEALNKSNVDIDLPQDIIDRVYKYYAEDKVLYDKAVEDYTEAKEGMWD